MSHGGPRSRAGRPAGAPELVKVPVGLRLPRWLLDWLRAQPRTQAELIEDALIQTYRLTPPPNQPKREHDHVDGL